MSQPNPPLLNFAMRAHGRIAFRRGHHTGNRTRAAALRRLSEGNNLGKQLLRLADPPLPLNGDITGAG